MVCISIFMTLPLQFTIIRPIHKCEILTMHSDFSIHLTKMCRVKEISILSLLKFTGLWYRHFNVPNDLEQVI